MIVQLSTDDCELIHVLRQTITCSICLEIIKNPSALPCSHVYCFECLQNAIDLYKKCSICSTKATRRDITNGPVQVIADAFAKLSDILLQSIDSNRLASSNRVSCCTMSDINNDEKPLISPIATSTAPAPAAVGTLTSATGGSSDRIMNSIHAIDLRNFRPSYKRLQFNVGDIVTVAPRLWPGINKPGGRGVVTDRNDDKSTYDVKYILSSGQDTEVPSIFVVGIEDLDRECRRTLKSKTADSSSSDIDCNHSSSSSSSSSKLEQPHKRMKKDLIVSAYHPSNKTSSLIRPCLLPSNLISEEYTLVEAFSKKFNNNIAALFDDSVTHLVVSIDHKSGALQHRTMKYMQAIMAGLWIVDINWLKDSMKEGFILHEEPYEVKKNIKATIENAPKRAREASMNDKPCHTSSSSSAAAGTPNTAITSISTGLFSGITFLLYGNFATPLPSKLDIKYLIECGNGIIIEKENDFIKSFNHDYTSNKNKDICYVAICSARYATIDNYMNHLDSDARKYLHVVNPFWLLNSVTDYKLASFTETKNSKLE